MPLAERHFAAPPRPATEQVSIGLLVGVEWRQRGTCCRAQPKLGVFGQSPCRYMTCGGTTVRLSAKVLSGRKDLPGDAFEKSVAVDFGLFQMRQMNVADVASTCRCGTWQRGLGKRPIGIVEVSDAILYKVAPSHFALAVDAENTGSCSADESFAGMVQSVHRKMRIQPGESL